MKGSLRGYKADIFDWVHDCSTVLNALPTRARGKPLYWIGHSLSGQIVPFVDRVNDIAKIITMSCCSGDWLENAWPLRRRVWLLWFIVAPLTLPLFGYFPGRPLLMVGNLPKDVMIQWRRWCLNPHYCVGAEGPAARDKFAGVKVPVVAFSFEDDEMMSKMNTESLHGVLTSAPVTMKRISPKDVGAQRIGHFGFFKEKFKAALWEKRLLEHIQGS